MAEDLVLHHGDKKTQYESLIPQIKGLMTGEKNLVANLGNITAALKEQFNWLWVGFYWVIEDNCCYFVFICLLYSFSFYYSDWIIFYLFRTYWYLCSDNCCNYFIYLFEVDILRCRFYIDFIF